LLAKRVIAKLDIKTDNVVKGVHMEGLRVVGKPSELSRKYDAQEADELIYIDTVASLYGRHHLLDIMQSVAEESFVPITVGGGIRSLDTARALLRVGADKIALNTYAFENPGFLTEAAEVFGAQAIVASIHAKSEGSDWICYVENGRERTGEKVCDWVKEVEALGAGEILLMSIDRDGTYSGFDLDLVRQVADAVHIPVIAAGGAGDVSSIGDVLELDGVTGVALASVLHYERLSVSQIKADLTRRGIPTRPIREH